MINKRQEKELAGIIEKSVFKKTDFEVSNKKINIYKSEEYKAIVYKGSNYYFNIYEGNYAGDYNIAFSPSDVDLERIKEGIDWDELIYQFTDWLIYLKEELEVGDIWTSVSVNEKLFEIGKESDEKFTEEEIKLLETSIEEVKEKVEANPNIPPEKKSLLLESFEYLKKVARKVTKLDWTNIAVGQIIRLSLTEDNLRFVFGLFKYIFSRNFLK